MTIDKKTKDWPKTWEDKFYGKFVFSDGYIAEQKPEKMIRFIASLLQAEKKEIKTKIAKKVKQNISEDRQFLTHLSNKDLNSILEE